MASVLVGSLGSTKPEDIIVELAKVIPAGLNCCFRTCLQVEGFVGPAYVSPEKFIKSLVDALQKLVPPIAINCSILDTNSNIRVSFDEQGQTLSIFLEPTWFCLARESAVSGLGTVSPS
jgi:hypothetical protein